MKNKVTKSTLGALVVIGILLSLCACAGTYLPTSMLKKFFLFTVNSEQSARQADPDKLSQNPISLLDDRIFINMPEGAVHPTEYQRQLLHVPEMDRIRNKDEVVWAGSNEILKVVAMESLRFVDPNWDAPNNIQLFEPEKDQLYSLKRNYYDLMSAYVRMPDNTRIELRFSLYTLGGKERVDHFYNVAKAIIETVAPGRPLNIEAQTVEWENLTFKTSDGYYVDLVNGKTQMYRGDDVDNAAVVYKLNCIDRKSCIILEIGKDLNVEKFSSGAVSKADSLLGETLDWKCNSDQFGVRTFGSIPLNNEKNLRISIIADNEQIAQELMDIVHTLVKK